MSDEEFIKPDLPMVDLTKIKNETIKELIDAGIITQEGIRISGIGLVLSKFAMMDRMNMLLSFIDKKLGGQTINGIKQPSSFDEIIRQLKLLNQEIKKCQMDRDTKEM